MAKEWILNQANMRWGLTRKDKVGPVAELIRKCAPKTLKDWENYYLTNVYPKEHLEYLGKILFVKVTDVCKAEIESITEEDCINPELCNRIFQLEQFIEIEICRKK